MFSKKNILLVAKICFCAMLMMLTTSVATASISSNFMFPNPIGTVMVSGGSIDNLALEFILPDGINNGGEDTLSYNGLYNDWTGAALTNFTANDYFLDNNYNGVWNPHLLAGGAPGVMPEAIWSDANTDNRIDPNEIAVRGYADLEPFDTNGNNTIWVYDSFAGDLGTGYMGGADFTPGLPWGEALFEDTNQSPPGFLGGGDSVIKAGPAGVINFDSPLLDPAGACGAPPVGPPFCNGNSNVFDIYFCDGWQGPPPNGIYDQGEAIFIDTWPSPTVGDFDAGIDVMVVDSPAPFPMFPVPCFATTPGAVPVSLTSSGPQKVVFLDADKNGTYGDQLIFGPGGPVFPGLPWGEPVVSLNTTTIGDFGVLAPPNVLGIESAHWNISPMSPNYLAFDMAQMNIANGGNMKFIGTTLGTGADSYTGVEAIVDESFGGTLNVLEPGEVVERATMPYATLTQLMALPYRYLDDPGGLIPGFIDMDDDIYDESTGSTVAVLDKGADILNAITFQNNGTMPQANIAAVKLWQDLDLDGVFMLLNDGPPLGTATWDGTDSWDLSGLTQAVAASAMPSPNKYFVTVDIVAAPLGGVTAEMFIPQCIDDGNLDCSLGLGNGTYDAGDEGVFVASPNEGPSDWMAIPIAVNRLMTAGSSSGGGGGGGGAADCGDGILDTGESCDDGNRTAGDGCSVYCSLEEGYVWDEDSETVMTEEEAAEEEEPPVDEEPEATPEADDVAGVAENFSDYDETHWAAEYIAQLFLANIMTGYGDGDLFGVAIGTTRAEIVKIALLANGVEVPESVDEAPFPDTALGEWFTPYVAKAAELGIVEGYEDGNFRPDNIVNRAEALKILLLAKGVDLTGYDLLSALSFSDVTEDLWYVLYVAYAVDNGIVEGYDDGTFRGGNDILRAEMAKITVLTMLLEMAA
ncbi:S-layer homology domain-containing protein [Patescibacteria group bacterium]